MILFYGTPKYFFGHLQPQLRICDAIIVSNVTSLSITLSDAGLTKNGFPQTTQLNNTFTAQFCFL